MNPDTWNARLHAGLPLRPISGGDETPAPVPDAAPPAPDAVPDSAADDRQWEELVERVGQETAVTPARNGETQIPLSVFKSVVEKEKARGREVEEMRARLELDGYKFQADGSILGPQPQGGPYPAQGPYPPQAPAYAPPGFAPQAPTAEVPREIVDLAESLGVEPEKVHKAFAAFAAPYAAPVQAMQGMMVQNAARDVAGQVEHLRRSDPDFPVYGQELLQHIARNYQQSGPQAVLDVAAVWSLMVENIKGRHQEAIFAHRMHQAAHPPKKVGTFYSNGGAGQFSEGANPGSGDGGGVSVDDVFSEAAQEMLRRPGWGMSHEDRQKMAENVAALRAEGRGVSGHSTRAAKTPRGGGGF